MLRVERAADVDRVCLAGHLEGEQLVANRQHDEVWLGRHGDHRSAGVEHFAQCQEEHAGDRPSARDDHLDDLAAGDYSQHEHHDGGQDGEQIAHLNSLSRCHDYDQNII